MYSAIGILVASKKKTESLSLGDHLMIWFFRGTCFFLAIDDDDDEPDASIWENAYPENIKAMGSIGSTNLSFII